MPHIVHLSLVHTTSLEDSLDWLQYREHQECPARHLQWLTVSSGNIGDLEALRNLIISRSNRTNYEDVGRLEALTIIGPKVPIEWFNTVREVCNDLHIKLLWTESCF